MQLNVIYSTVEIGVDRGHDAKIRPINTHAKHKNIDWDKDTAEVKHKDSHGQTDRWHLNQGWSTAFTQEGEEGDKPKNG